MRTKKKLTTIGHSNVTLETFLDRLHRQHLQVVVDVRSAPFSSYVPHFNKQPLAAELLLAGFKYLFMGGAIGGKPADRAFYDAQGRVRYDLLVEEAGFQAGLDRLEKGVAEGWRIGLMCAEENPLNCHRHWLIARELELVRKVPVWHLRADGSEMRAIDHFAGEAQAQQMKMF